MGATRSRARTTSRITAEQPNRRRGPREPLLSAIGPAVEMLEARRLLNGAIDTSFGQLGRAVTDFGQRDQADAMAVLADGSFIVVGSSGGRFAVAKYNADGSADTTFGAGSGRVTTAIGANAHATSVAIDGSGRIVVGGYALVGRSYDFALARYDALGNLDTGFGRRGVVTTDFAQRSDYIFALTIQPDGKILTVGTVRNGPDPQQQDFALARYNAADGSLDSSFGRGGKVTTDFGAADDARAVAFDESLGAIVVAGGSGGNFALARYTLNGKLDSRFDGDGQLVTILPQRSIALAVGIDPAGRYLAAGHSGGDFAVIRVDPRGAPDASFGDAGQRTIDFAGGFDQANAVAFQPDGKILLGGVATSGGRGDFALARLTPAGALDPTFGAGTGLLCTDLSGGADVARTIAFQPQSDRILLAGTTHCDETGGNFSTVMLQSDVTEVWVNDSWVIAVDSGTPGLSPGDLVQNTGTTDAGATITRTWGFDAFSSIADAMAAVAAGGTVHVLSGNYVENVVITRPLTLAGQTEATPKLLPADAGLATIVVHADDVSIHSLSVASSPGFTEGGGGVGIDVDGGSVAIDNMTITGNDIGVLVRNGGQVTSMTQNFITNNAVAAVKIESTAGSIAAIVNNDLSGPGAAIDNASAATIDASGNYFGADTSPAAVAARNLGDVDFTPWLNLGTDTSGDPGFQGDFSELNIGVAGEQTGTDGRIQEAINLVTSGGTVFVHAGTYLESDINVNKPLIIDGVGSPAGNIVAPAVPDGHLTGAGVLFDPQTHNAFVIRSGGVTIRDLTIDGDAGVGGAGSRNFFGGVVYDHTLGQAFDNLQAKNLRVRNLWGVGIYFDGGTNALSTGHLLSGNTINTIGGSFAPTAVLMLQASGTIRDNTISDVETGIASNYIDGPAFAPTLLIRNNSLSDVSGAMSLSGLAGGSLIGGPDPGDANIIDLTAGPGVNDIGIIVQFSVGPVTVQGNQIMASDRDAGIWLFRNDASAATLITDNTITTTGSNSPSPGEGTGIFATDDGSLFGGSASGNTHATIAGNTISGFARGIHLDRTGSAGSFALDIQVEGNTLTNNALSVRAFKTTAVTIADNIITLDVGSLTESGTVIELESPGGMSLVDGNVLTLSGTMGGGVNHVHGIELRGGGTAAVTISRNELDGGDVDTVPASDSAGVRLHNSLPSSAVIQIRNNVLRGFVDGVQAGNVAAGMDLKVNENDLSGNSNKGLVNGNGAKINASVNWWGDASAAVVVAQANGGVNVRYNPWLGDGTDSDPMQTGFQPNLSPLFSDGLSISGAATVDEGSLYTLTLSDDGTSGVVTSWTIDWGDGPPEVITGNPASVTHIYADGPANFVISAVATTSLSQMITVSDTVNVGVTDVPPVIPVSGAATVNEGAIYTLNLGAVFDPGDDTVFRYIINWGDGNFKDVTGNPDNTIHTHVYDDGPAVRQITISLFDETGTPHFNTGNPDPLEVQVLNVAPTAIFFNGGPVPEGSNGFVGFASQFDPSSADTAAGFLYSYDFNNDGDFTGPGELSDVPNPSVGVPAMYLADGPGTRTVRGRIKDKDGGFTDYFTTITIANVTPFVNAGPDISVPATIQFTQQGNFFDPGDDAPWTATVDYDINDGNPPVPLALSGFNFTLSHVYPNPGTYTIRVAVTDKDGATGIDHVTVNVGPAPTFLVSQFLFNASGFTVRFNRPLDLSDLNIYDGIDGFTPSNRPPDIELVGNNVGVVRGSVVWEPALNRLAFVKTGGPLVPDLYTLTLRSAADAFKDTLGHLLDGNADGTDGGDFVTTFTVSDVGQRTLSIPDFARGPDSASLVNLPNTGTAGIPIWIDNGAQVRSVDFTLTYNSNLLVIDAVQVADGLPPDWAITSNLNTPGTAVVTVFGTSTDLVSGPVDIVKLMARVPDTAPYGAAGIMRIQSITVSRNNATVISTRGDHGVHKVVYFGDADADRDYTGFDAGLVSRVIVGLDSGFHALPLTDPLIIADIDGSGTLTGIDASFIAQKAAMLPRPEIPDLPGVLPPLVPGGIDPFIDTPTNKPARPGTSTVMPVNIDDATNTLGFNVTLDYDTNVLDVIDDVGGTSPAVSLGSLFASAGGWSVTTNVDDASGRVTLVFWRSNGVPMPGGSGEIATVQFDIAPSPTHGTVIPIQVGGTESVGGLMFTHGDGSILIDTVEPTVIASQFVYATAPHRLRFTFSEDVSASLSESDFVVINTSTSTTIPSSQFTLSYDSTTNVATLTYDDNVLPDGHYTVTLVAAGVNDAAGNVMAADHVFNFLFLLGDANNDGIVNLTDFNILAANFGQSPRDYTEGDFNYDGVVNLADFNILAAQFGVSLSGGSLGSIGGSLPIPPAPGSRSGILDDETDPDDVLGEGTPPTAPLFGTELIGGGGPDGMRVE